MKEVTASKRANKNVNGMVDSSKSGGRGDLRLAARRIRHT